MSRRKTQLEVAIDKAQAEINQLEAFIARLKDQQAAKPKHKPLVSIRKRRSEVEDGSAVERATQA